VDGATGAISEPATEERREETHKGANPEAALAGGLRRRRSEPQCSTFSDATGGATAVPARPRWRTRSSSRYVVHGTQTLSTRLLTQHTGNGAGWSVASSRRRHSKQHTLTRCPPTRRPFVVGLSPCSTYWRMGPLLTLCTRSASPFWRTASNTAKPYETKKVIGASYSHTDILKFDNLCVRFGHICNIELTVEGMSRAPARAPAPHHPPPTVASPAPQQAEPRTPHLPLRDARIPASSAKRRMTGTTTKERAVTSCSKTTRTSSDCPA
jgi:hypothetical protein